MINGLWDFAAAHQAVLGAAGLWIFSALVRTMPEPTDKSSTAYRWLHDFMHFAGANFDKVGK